MRYKQNSTINGKCGIDPLGEKQKAEHYRSVNTYGGRYVFKFTLIVLALGLPLLVVSAQEAESNSEAAESSTSDAQAEPEMVASAEGILREVMNKETTRAIKTALSKLAGLQDKETGSFGAPNIEIAVASLSGLALMASGSLPDTGPYSKNIQRLVDFLLKHQDPNTGFFSTGKDDGSRIHGHGYATLFLSQVYGHCSDSVKIRKSLNRAVKLLESGMTKHGGWGYMPDDTSWDETSTTICALQALRGAQSVGIGVKNTTIAKAIGYMAKVATPQTVKLKDGSLTQMYTFKYSIDRGMDSNSYSLVGAACSSLNNIGIYSKHARWHKNDMGKMLRGGMAWLRHQLDDYLERYADGQMALDTRFFYYGNLYACQACWQYDDIEIFKYFFPRVRDVLVADYRRSGHAYWNHRSYGKAYATAMALLTLQVPYQYLPAFQR